jgi:hypothetical protein
VSLLAPEDFPGYEELRERTVALLQESAEVTLLPSPEERALVVRIQNLAGHALPSGATADREMWLETFIRDANGQVVFESGTLDDHGDLRIDDAERTTAPGTDPQLALYSQKMYFDPSIADPASTEPRRRVDFLWQPNRRGATIAAIVAVRPQKARIFPDMTGFESPLAKEDAEIPARRSRNQIKERRDACRLD